MYSKAAASQHGAASVAVHGAEDMYSIYSVVVLMVRHKPVTHWFASSGCSQIIVKNKLKELSAKCTSVSNIQLCRKIAPVSDIIYYLYTLQKNDLEVESTPLRKFQQKLNILTFINPLRPTI